MILLPYEKYSYWSELTVAEVTAILEERFETWKTFYTIFRSAKHGYEARPEEENVYNSFFRGTKPGCESQQTEEKSYNIRRIIRYNNPFLPLITINARKEGEGTKIAVLMRPHLVGLGIILYFFLTVLNLILISRHWPPGASAAGILVAVGRVLLMILGAELFFYLFIMLGYKPEALKARKDLARFFPARKGDTTGDPDKPVYSKVRWNPVLNKRTRG